MQLLCRWEKLTSCSKHLVGILHLLHADTGAAFRAEGYHRSIAMHTSVTTAVCNSAIACAAFPLSIVTAVAALLIPTGAKLWGTAEG